MDKCYKLQRLRRQTDKGKRVAASVQQYDSGLVYNDPTLNQSSEQYAQVLALLNK